MKNQKIQVTEFNNDESFLDQIARLVLDSMIKMKGGKFLIIDRQRKGDFFSVFSDALFDYDAGIVLIERFFRREKCKLKGEKVKTFSDEDKKIIAEFETFSSAIPKAATLSEEERAEYTNKVNLYLDKINTMKPDITVLDSYAYKKYILTEFDNIDDETLDKMSSLYGAFCTNFITALTWAPLQGLSIGITTIEYEDYIDMVLMPIKIENEEN